MEDFREVVFVSLTRDTIGNRVRRVLDLDGHSRQ